MEPPSAPANLSIYFINAQCFEKQLWYHGETFFGKSIHLAIYWLNGHSVVLHFQAFHTFEMWHCIILLKKIVPEKLRIERRKSLCSIWQWSEFTNMAMTANVHDYVSEKAWHLYRLVTDCQYQSRERMYMTNVVQRETAAKYPLSCTITHDQGRQLSLLYPHWWYGASRSNQVSYRQPITNHVAQKSVEATVQFQ